MQLRGRQTQFYIDLIYGLGFAVGFGYLLIVGMDPLVAAFQSGLVLGYFLRVWENMSVYERILHEEVAAEAEEAVADEIEDTMPDEVEEAVAEEFEDKMPEEVEEAVTSEVEEAVAAEAEEAVASEIEEAVAAEVEGAVADEAETAIPEEVAAEVEKQVAEEMADEIKERVRQEMKNRLETVGERVPEQVKKNRTARSQTQDDDPDGTEPPSKRGDGAPSGQQ
jgi:hypothetical protein